MIVAMAMVHLARARRQAGRQLKDLPHALGTLPYGVT